MCSATHRHRLWERESLIRRILPTYRRPRSLAELGAVSGVGPAKLERYGEQVLALVGADGQR